LRKLGIECYKFHPFRPILSGMYNNRDHRKIVIIDHEMAFTGGMNLADEYGNVIERFGYWKDTMIKIEGSGINNLIITFLQNFDLSCHKISDYDKYIKYKYKEYDTSGYVMPFGDGPGGIDNALIGEQTYINILHYAKHEVYISTPYLVPTYGLIDALRNAATRGVKVHLIVPGIPDKKLVYRVAETNFRYLMSAGVKIYRYKPGFNHMKSIIADGKLAMVGTINFDFRSLVHHYECGAVLYKTECMKDILEDFKQMLSVSEEVPANFKPKNFTRLLCAVLKIITPLM
jgi:cardiolipin synthase